MYVHLQLFKHVRFLEISSLLDCACEGRPHCYWVHNSSRVCMLFVFWDRLDSIRQNFSVTRKINNLQQKYGNIRSIEIHNLPTNLEKYATSKYITRKNSWKHTQHRHVTKPVNANTYNYIIYSESVPDACFCILFVFRYRPDSISLSL
jgi:hypothetical protein